MRSDRLLKFLDYHAGGKDAKVPVFFVAVHGILVGQLFESCSVRILLQNEPPEAIDGVFRQRRPIQVYVARSESVFYCVRNYFVFLRSGGAWGDFGRIALLLVWT